MELRPRQDAAAAVSWVEPTGDDPPSPILFTGSEPDEEMIAALRAAPAIARARSSKACPWVVLTTLFDRQAAISLVSPRSHAPLGAECWIAVVDLFRRSTPGWTQLSATFFPYGGPLINARLVKAAAPLLFDQPVMVVDSQLTMSRCISLPHLIRSDEIASMAAPAAGLQSTAPHLVCVKLPPWFRTSSSRPHAESSLDAMVARVRLPSQPRKSPRKSVMTSAASGTAGGPSLSPRQRQRLVQQQDLIDDLMRNPSVSMAEAPSKWTCATLWLAWAHHALARNVSRLWFEAIARRSTDDKVGLAWAASRVSSAGFRLRLSRQYTYVYSPEQRQPQCVVKNDSSPSASWQPADGRCQCRHPEPKPEPRVKFKCAKLADVDEEPPPSCRLRTSECMCSNGCQSTWQCKPSRMCGGDGSERLVSRAAAAEVPLLLFLHFNRSQLRHRFAGRPMDAYAREARRIEWLIRSARLVNTSMPIHVVVGGDRSAEGEARLRRLGAQITPSAVVQPPRWASSFHKLSFSRIAALGLTQFKKVVVLDNDMALAGNIDELAVHAEAPAMVWHTSTIFASKEFSAPTGGLFVLEPSAQAFLNATRHLAQMNGRSPRRCYDGSDQEFWRDFYRAPRTPLIELPLRYHAHNGLVTLKPAEWRKVKIVHGISGFKYLQDRVPTFVRSQLRFFTGDRTDEKRLGPGSLFPIDGSGL